MMLNRVSLNTIGLNRIGLNRIGKPSRGSSDRPYIDPEVLASLKAVCICYGKSNDDPDRAVVKNLVDPDNPFVISNAAFKLNSGFGKYEDDFTNWVAETGTKLTSDKITNSNPTKKWIAYRSSGVEFKEMHIRILGIPDNGVLYFQRPAADGGPIIMFNGDNNIPAFTSTGICGFFINNLTGLGWSNLVIEQIPSFEGAFVTDGVNDLITSTKSATEMLDGSNEITVVSMIHQIDKPSNFITTNNIITPGSVVGRNGVSLTDKTGIYGWYKDNIQGSTINVINNILGDKADYTASASSNTNLSSKFSVVGYISNDSINETSSVAWYWTIIANKVLTTDQINQVIAYFNLDKTLKPDILCNTIKQGITNDNHAEFGDKLIDFSGNGRDIQLNNIAWDGDSGIGKYSYPGWKLTANKAGKYRNIRIYQTLNGTYTAKFEGVTELYNRVGIELEILSKNRYVQIKEDGIYSVDPVDDATELQVRFGDYTDTELYDCDITITQIPSHAGALCLDGVNDFGKVTGMPIYKDYTFIIDYERISYTSEGWGGAIVSKSPSANNGAFISMMANSAGTNKQLFSFGGVTAFIKDDLSRILFWQTKYKSENTELTVGEGVDGDTLWLGTLRDNDSRFFNGAIYSLMSFPYSMSEFLIERQLKKHKLGTLYPDMVEFRPIVKSNLPYSSISYSVNPGEYISVDSMVTITVTLPNTSDKLMEVSCNAISDISISGDNGVYEITGKIVKSPQKINLVISSYLTMLNNETLISNETLIKNE